MKTIIFVCHGNICRSPAAEYIFKKILKDHHKENEYIVFSRALSNEEIGNDIYPPMKEELRKNHIPFDLHYAKRLTEKECEEADVIYYMDDSNQRMINYYYPEYLDKFMPIYLFEDSVTQIEDPWYTKRFNLVFNQIEKCLKKIFEYL